MDDASEQGVRARGSSPRKTARTRGAIMRAALDTFLQHGFQASSMSDIAARAGIAKGTCYRYFTSKEVLFEAVLTEAVVAPIAELKARDPGQHETVKAFMTEVLLPFMRAFQDTERSMVARLIMAEGERFPAVAASYARHVYRPFNDMVRDCARLALDKGELRTPDLLEHPELLTAPIWIGIVHNHILCPEDPIDIGTVFALQLDMLFPG